MDQDDAKKPLNAVRPTESGCCGGGGKTSGTVAKPEGGSSQPAKPATAPGKRACGCGCH
jgi:hypothetical protein